MAVALGLLTQIYLLSSWALLVLSHSFHLSWSQDNTRLLSSLLIPITDAYIPLIFEISDQCCRYFGGLGSEHLHIPYQSHGDFWFLSPPITRACEPLGLVLQPTHRYLSQIWRLYFIPTPSCHHFGCCAIPNAELLRQVCDGHSLCPGNQRLNDGSLDSPKPMCVCASLDD